MQALTLAERDELQRAEIRQRLSAPTVQELACCAAAIYGVTPAAILGRQAARHIVWARHWVFYHALMAGRSTASEIGRRMGRDHSSVLYGAAAHAMRHQLPSPSQCYIRKLSRSVPLRALYEGPEPTVDAPFDIEVRRAQIRVANNARRRQKRRERRDLAKSGRGV